MSDLVTALRPVADALSGLDLSDRAAAERALRDRVPDDVRAALVATIRDAHAASSLTPRQASPGLWFGRLAKPSDATRGFSIDVVDMAEAGAVHTHPQGEVSLLVPLEGEPVFEGAREGFVVLPPGSRHVPDVTGGRMLVVYWLPDGAVAWG